MRWCVEGGGNGGGGGGGGVVKVLSCAKRIFFFWWGVDGCHGPGLGRGSAASHNFFRVTQRRAAPPIAKQHGPCRLLVAQVNTVRQECLLVLGLRLQTLLLLCPPDRR